LINRVPKGSKNKIKKSKWSKRKCVKISLGKYWFF